MKQIVSMNHHCFDVWFSLGKKMFLSKIENIEKCLKRRCTRESLSVVWLNVNRLSSFQVYAFAQIDSTDMEQAEGMREYTPPKKKKKKKHSQWLNHCRKTQFKDVGTTQVHLSVLMSYFSRSFKLMDIQDGLFSITLMIKIWLT